MFLEDLLGSGADALENSAGKGFWLVLMVPEFDESSGTPVDVLPFERTFLDEPLEIANDSTGASDEEPEMAGVCV